MPQSTDDSVQQRLRQTLESRIEILGGYLFGSHAIGRAQAHGDIDIAVYVATDYALDQGFGCQVELTAALMAALQTNDIDVVILKRAPPLLYHRVLAQGERLAKFDEFARAITCYLEVDADPHRDRRHP